LKVFLTILIFILITGDLYAGKEAYNWYFGVNAGITFDTGDLNPLLLNNGALVSEEGCATVSNEKGKVLFYTNGVTVWNRNNIAMQGGTGLMGSTNSTQSAIIIPKPDSPLIYYIITTDDAEGTRGCRYSVVDMSRDGGFGAVISKNSLLFNSTTEKLVGIRHGNGKDWWVLAHEWESDVFRAFLIDNTGIHTFAVFSIAGTTHQGDDNNKSGYMKVSRNGTKLALALPEDGAVELFDFDNWQGKVSNPVYLSSLVLKDVYGLEFSPSGEKLYVTKQEAPSAILQYDLTTWTQSGILNTQTLIRENKGFGAFQALQVGPDNKIYVARYDKNFLGRINEPDKPGRFCNYVDSAVYLKDKIVKKGLPNIVSDDVIKIVIDADSPVCIGDNIRLETDKVFGAEYNWTGPLGFMSDKRIVVIPATSLLQSGFYKLEIAVSGMQLIDSVFILVSPSPEVNIELEGTPPYCDGDSIKLTALTDDNDNAVFLWSTGDTTGSIFVKKSGLYSVTVTDTAGCSTTKDTVITINKIATKIVPMGPTEFCRGDTVTLVAAPYEPGSTLEWSTGESSQSIVIRNSQEVVLKISSAQGCEKFDTVNVHVYDHLNVEAIIEGDGTFCEGDTVTVKTNYEGTDFIYQWSTGEISPQIKLVNDYSGWVYVRLKSGCGDTAFFKIDFNIKPNIFISTDKPPQICAGDIITLKALTNNITEKLYYDWSTGDTTQEIKVSDPGRYTVKVTSDSGCSNQTYIDITVLPAPTASIEADGPTELCSGAILKLVARPDSSEYSYLWSTGDTTREISVISSGDYYVVVSNKNHCGDTARISVTFYDKPDVKIEADGPLKICKGDMIVLSTQNKYLSYHWNTGDTTESITVSSAGQYWVAVIDSNGCDGQSDTVEAIVSEVDIIIDDLSQTKFGKVCTGISKEQTFKIINNSSEDIEISNLQLHGANNFTVNSYPSLPVILPQDTALVVKLNFSPDVLGQYTDTLTVSVVSPCYYQYDLNIGGDGIVRTYAKIPDTVRPIGMQYCIPVRFYLNCGDTLGQRVYFKTKVSIDAATFLPDDDLHPFVKRHYVSGSKRIFEIEGWLDSLTGNPKDIFYICGTILLGDFEWVNIELDDIETDNSYFSSLALGGELEIYGVCEFTISRIQMSPPTVINIYKNKGDNDIKIGIETAERGNFEFAIYSLTGVKRYSYFFSKSNDKKTEYIITPDLSKFESGYYRLVLISGNSVKSVPLIINK
jgi:hypothetical protein